jgi:hypothetical protein
MQEFVGKSENCPWFAAGAEDKENTVLFSK